MRSHHRRRQAFSAMELIVSIALLTSALVAVSQFVSHAGRAQHNQELSARLQWEIINARETIGSWHPAQVTPERIVELPVSEQLKEHISGLRWETRVATVRHPLPALRINLQLQGEHLGQAIAPERLTFWIVLEENADES